MSDREPYWDISKKDEKISTSEKHVDSVDATTNFLPRSNDSLTRRDYFAAAALSGILSYHGDKDHSIRDHITSVAILYADKLIKELDKENDDS